MKPVTGQDHFTEEVIGEFYYVNNDVQWKG